MNKYLFYIGVGDGRFCIHTCQRILKNLCISNMKAHTYTHFFINIVGLNE